MRKGKVAKSVAFHPAGSAVRCAPAGGPLTIVIMGVATIAATVGITLAGPATADSEDAGYVESIGTPADMWTIDPALVVTEPTPARALPEDPARVDNAIHVIDVDIVVDA